MREVNRCDVQRRQPELTLAPDAEAMPILGGLCRDGSASSDVQPRKRVENFRSRGQVRVIGPN